MRSVVFAPGLPGDQFPGLQCQYISLAKNSALAVDVGFTRPFYSVAGNHPQPDGRGTGGVSCCFAGAYLDRSGC